MEQLGLQAILKDEDFQKGLAAYLKGVDTASKKTDEGAERMSGMSRASDAVGTALSAAAGIATGVFVAGIAAATAIIAGFVFAGKQGLETTLAWGGQLDSLGDAFGFSGEKASGFTFLANKMGLSVDEMGMGLRSLINGLQGVDERLKTGGKTLSPFEKALAKIGVSAFDSKGKLKTFDALMPELMDKFSKLPAGVNASALAMDLFGTRGGTKFLDFLRQGSQGLKDAEVRAKELGLSLSTDQVNAVEDLGFAWNEFQLGVKGVWNQIGLALLPTLKDLTSWLNKEVIPVFSKWAKDNAPAITQALKDLGQWIMTTGLPALKQLGDWFIKEGLPALIRFGDWIQKEVIPVIMQLWKFLNNPPNTSELSSGFANIMKVIDPVLKLLSKFWTDIQPKLTKAWANIQKITKQAWDFIWLKVIKPAVEAIQAFIDKHGDQIVRILDGVWKEIQGAIKVAWALISGTLKIALDILGGDFEAAGEDWQTAMSDIWDGIQDIFSGAWEAIQGIIVIALRDLIQYIQGQANNVINAITKPFTDAKNAVANIDWGAIGTSLVNAITSTLGSSATNILNAITKPFTDAKNFILGIDWAGAAYNIASAMYNQIIAWADSIRDAVKDGFVNAYNWLRDNVSTLANKAWDIMNNIYETVIGWADYIFHAIYDPFSNAIDLIKQLLGIASPSKLMRQIGEQMTQGLMQGFNPQLAASMAYAVQPVYGGGGVSHSYSSSTITHNTFNLSVNSAHSVGNVVRDFGVMRSLVR